ncbi:MAG: hypothetical protein F4046_04925 [Acidimicrobiaceae bacterium]|nr:hypothetical protein [Acidimicrobiaceae bacterium]
MARLRSSSRTLSIAPRATSEDSLVCRSKSTFIAARVSAWSRRARSSPHWRASAPAGISAAHSAT